jgi:nucleotide-binding universal stress UspA family protein
MRWETIVVGYDDTDDSRRALGRAIVLAKTMDARLIVLSVSRVLPSGAAAHGIGPFDPADPPLEHRDALERIREAVAGEDVEVEFDLEIGHPADALLALAERRNAHLIVVGTREPGFIDRLLNGSVSQDVARHSRRDVLIVH